MLLLVVFFVLGLATMVLEVTIGVLLSITVPSLSKNLDRFCLILPSIPTHMVVVRVWAGVTK